MTDPRYKKDPEYKECPECDGLGIIIDDYDFSVPKIECPICEGLGQIEKDDEDYANEKADAEEFKREQKNDG